MNGANFQAANKPTLPHDMLYDPNSIEWEPDPDILRDLLLEREADLEIERRQSASQLPPEPGPAREDNGQLTHDIAMAKEFLTSLDPKADKYTFQFFRDDKNNPEKYARVFHGTLGACGRWCRS